MRVVAWIDRATLHRASTARPTSVDLAFATAMSLGGIAVAVLTSRWNGNAFYAPMLAAVTLSTWYGGTASGLAAVTICWSGAWLANDGADWVVGVPEGSMLVSWCLALALAIVIVAWPRTGHSSSQRGVDG